MTHSDEPAADLAEADQYERDYQALYERIAAFMDDEKVAESYTADLLLDVAVHLRMTAYATDTDKPSVAGLKLDLDRLQRDVADRVRDAKREAPDFIEEVKAALAAEAGQRSE